MARISRVALFIIIGMMMIEKSEGINIWYPGKKEGRWTERANLPTGRSDSGVSVAGTDAIILTGGCDGPQDCKADFCSCSSISAKTEIFHPEQNTWSSAPDMPRKRFRHGQETINGIVYIFGGRDESDNLVPQVDVFDYSSKTWSTLPENRQFNSTLSDFATVLVNNTIYVIGGYDAAYANQGSMWFFNPTATSPVDAWKKSPAELIYPRGDVCAVLRGNDIFLVGGFDDTFCYPKLEWEVYDVTKGKWEAGTAIPKTKGGDKACGLIHGSFLTMGGELKDPKNCTKYSEPSKEATEYWQPTEDTTSGEWIDLVDIPQPRFRFSAVYYLHSNGYEAVYTFGGQGAYDLASQSYPVSTSVYAWSDYTLPNTPLTGGQIAGIVIGCAVFLAIIVIIVLVVVYFMKKKKEDRKDKFKMEDF
eukprot:TRINITY_DN6641_c0_g1_i1.p1 TRINITY_DN6641_c0_g1~~TRINITY_DN6641_c0_g1_i1.p1  ORF type:complete len:444 (+),score=163.39 TRINITY_DN6641_c0_g1_i1:79-1332(+)